MVDIQPSDRQIGRSEGSPRFALLLVGGGLLALVGAGLLLWWRMGEQLFTDGLIASILSCF